jgi:hypothetical protein
MPRAPVRWALFLFSLSHIILINNLIDIAAIIMIGKAQCFSRAAGRDVHTLSATSA